MWLPGRSLLTTQPAPSALASSENSLPFGGAVGAARRAGVAATAAVARGVLMRVGVTVVAAVGVLVGTSAARWLFAGRFRNSAPK